MCWVDCERLYFSLCLCERACVSLYWNWVSIHNWNVCCGSAYACVALKTREVVSDIYFYRTNLPTVKKFPRCLYSFWHDPRTWQTHRDIHTACRHRPRLCIASGPGGKNQSTKLLQSTLQINPQMMHINTSTTVAVLVTRCTHYVRRPI